MSYAVEVFYDGDCPLCMRGIRMLQRKDKAGNIRFTDIAAADFVAADYGKTQEEFMARIKGRRPDGEWIDGPDVFRALYTAVGFDKLVKLSRAPGVSTVVHIGYKFFAKNRLRLTGRKDCDSGTCEIPRGSI